MDTDVRQLVQLIHDSSPRIMLVAAGAGTEALSDLLGVAGATRTLLEALVPYSKAASTSFLGQTPAQFVAESTARLMAGRAYTRAHLLADADYPLVGLACTATIVTDRPKRGEHRAHIATWQPERLVRYELRLEKGARNRPGEENIVSRVMLNGLASAYGLTQRLAVDYVAGDDLETAVYDFAQMTRKLHRQEIPFFGIQDNGHILTSAPASPLIILCGSFNPLHKGHLALAHTAMEMLNQPIAFELSALNVDKPPVAPETVVQRIAQFAGRYTILASNAPTFVEKARLYPGAIFVVGYDTAVRILSPQYYDNSQEKMFAALSVIQQQGCQFLVGGRIGRDGRFRQCNDLTIPDPFRPLFQGIPAHRFRKDVSSSHLRATGQKGSR